MAVDIRKDGMIIMKHRIDLASVREEVRRLKEELPSEQDSTSYDQYISELTLYIDAEFGSDYWKRMASQPPNQKVTQREPIHVRLIGPIPEL